MKFKIPIDWIAVGLSVIGSLMVSLPYDWQRLIGFLLFMTANILWIIFCRINFKPELRAVLILNIFYLITSIIGIYNNY